MIFFKDESRSNFFPKIFFNAPGLNTFPWLRNRDNQILLHWENVHHNVLQQINWKKKVEINLRWKLTIDKKRHKWSMYKNFADRKQMQHYVVMKFCIYINNIKFFLYWDERIFFFWIDRKRKSILFSIHTVSELNTYWSG